MRLIEKVWFYHHRARYLIVPLLLPLTLLFMLITKLRRCAYRYGVKKSVKIAKPVIVVGNIGIGGNGKTPIVLWLIAECRKLGLTPGVISRGYGGKADIYPYLLNEQSSASESGDEPLMIYRRTQALVCVGSDRIASAKVLIDQGCDIIIADDGLQHYRLVRDLEIIVIDGKRRFGNGFLLPAGPLREGQWRLNTVDYVITNGHKAQGREIPMCLVAAQFINCLSGECLTKEQFLMQYKQVNAIAGIGAPERFFTEIRQHGLHIEQQQGFIDHHQFSATDLSKFSNRIPLLMTEKDAVKCTAFAQAHWWYLTVDAQIPQLITKLIRQHIIRLSKNN